MTLPPEVYLLIPLTRDQFAKVDPEEFEDLVKWKWHAYWNASTKSFYAVRKLPREVGSPRKQVWMHRQILGLEYKDSRQCDHANHDTLDNRKANLRVATRSQNQANTKRQSNNKVGYKGVSWHVAGKCWRVRIWHKGTEHLLGYFKSPEDAYAAYCEAAKRVHGEFAHF